MTKLKQYFSIAVVAAVLLLPGIGKCEDVNSCSVCHSNICG